MRTMEPAHEAARHLDAATARFLESDEAMIQNQRRGGLHSTNSGGIGERSGQRFGEASEPLIESARRPSTQIQKLN